MVSGAYVFPSSEQLTCKYLSTHRHVDFGLSGVAADQKAVHMLSELIEADTNASTRNPLPIPVTRPIRHMKELVLVGRIVLNNIRHC